MDLLTNFGDFADEDIVLAGILHDVLEDTNLKYSELLKGFGSRVASIVSALTDDKTQTLQVRRQQAINKLGTSPKSVKIIKLADACSNASATPGSWTKEKVAEYFMWLDQIALSCRDASEELYLEYLSRRHTES
jgi:(p)ppGpp synthase/HD superfamily hydrolase